MTRRDQDGKTTRRRGLALGIGAGFLAFASLTAFASPASAADRYTMHTDDGDPGGVVSFWPNGDRVEVSDIEQDGWAVRLKVWDATTGKYKYGGTVGGFGNWKGWRASLGGKYNLAEKHLIKFEVCLVKSGRPSYCDTSKWRNNN
ncbi:hypothetical protein [Spirillospora sp. CA-128828]|uniref:hypothetical protein n=1 Tax=Spirillospora sp. CA-128828 TaxID=3240033 RepID=UPI003D92EF6A